MAGKGKGLAIGKKTSIVEKPVNGNDDDNVIDQSTSGAANRINGGDGNDNIVGTDFADRVNAGDGDDTVMGGAGDDVLFGNDGKDTAAYEGSIFNFIWEEGKGNSLTVTDTTGAEGVDTLKQFECLKFDDYTFDLTGPNAALILADDQTTDEDNATGFSIQAWDFDGGSPFISSISVTGGGTVSATSSGSLAQGMGTGTGFDISYDPNGAYETLAVGETTTETITVVIDDGQGNLSSKDIVVTITGVNDAPTLGAGAMGAIEDGAVEVLDLSALGDDIDSDDDGSTLTYTVTGAPAEGSASIAGTSLAFDPGSDFQNLAVGETRDVVIEVTATDAHGAQAVNNVTVTVTGTNDAPTLSAAATSATEDGASVNVDLAALGADVDSDDDGSTLTYSVSGAPAEGSASISGTTLTFDPGADFQDLAVGETRDVTVQVTATDQHGATAVNDVTVTVTGTNDAPVIGAADVSGEVTAQPVAPETTGSSEIEFTVNQYLGYGGNNEATMRSIIANPGSYQVFTDTTDVIDYTDDPAGFSGELPGSSPWPAEQHYGAAGTGQWYNNNFFAHITTEFSVGTADTYTFRTFNDDGVFLYIDGVRVIYDTGYHPEYPFQGSIALSPGNHTLELFFFEGGGEASLELSVRDSSGNFGLLGGGGGGLSGTGIVLTDSGSIDFTDVDLSDTHTVSVTPNGSGYLGDMTASLADASTGDGAGSVDWDFSVSNDDLAYLAAGESLTQSYTVTVTDNNGVSDTEVVTVTLNGTNDDPTASAIVAPATNEDAGTAAIDLLATAADVDLSDDLDVANVAVSSSDGRSITWSVDNETGAFEFDAGQYNDLAVGESATVTVEYDVTDGNGGVVANTASITVEGRNDAPTATGGTGSVTEDGTLTAGGTIALSDPDASDTHSFSVQGGGAGAYGTLSVDGSGNWTYALNNGAANVQALAQGQTVYENFTVNVSDGNGGTTTAPVQVAVTGTNDAPVAQDVTLVAAVTGNSGFDNGWAGWTRDAGPNGGLGGIYISGGYNYSFNINTSGNLIAGDYAVADISFGGWLNQYFDGPSLGTAFGPKLISDDFSGRAGDLVSFEYRAYSGGDAASIRAQLINVDTGAVTPVFFEQTPRGQTSPVKQIDVPIAAAGNYRIEFTVGSFDATDGGWVGARLAIGTAGIVRSGVSEGDATTFEAIQFLNDATDVDNGAVISLHSVDATSALGASVSIDGAGNVFYDASGITHLAAGESAMDTFTYWVTDEHGALAQAEASITVNGVNDAPIAFDDSAFTTASTPITLDLAENDNDPDGDALSVFSVGNASNGSVVLNNDGTVTYTPNAGFAGFDTFNYQVSDGNGGFDTASVTMTVGRADSSTVGTDVFLQGNFMELGIAGAGSLGSANAAPAGYHPNFASWWSGVTGQISYIVDMDGWDAGSASAPTRSGDATLPGSPVDGFVVGYQQSGVTRIFSNDERSGLNQLGASTTDTSSGSELSATTTGSASGALAFEQVISLNPNDTYYTTTVTFTNTSGSDMQNVRFMRTFDPDQDQVFYGDYRTNNDVLSNPDGNSDIAISQAYGPRSGISVNLIAIDEDARGSNFGFANRNAYTSSAWDNPVDRNGSYIDQAITMTFNIASLGAGETVTKSFVTSMNGAGSANDYFVGSNGANTIDVGAGDDIVIAMGGNDTVTLGAGDDVFIFAAGHGTDVITDFNAGASTADSIDISSFGLSGLGDIHSLATDIGGDVLIDFGGGNSIRLTGVNEAQLHEDDFIF